MDLRDVEVVGGQALVGELEGARGDGRDGAEFDEHRDAFPGAGIDEAHFGEGLGVRDFHRDVVEREFHVGLAAVDEAIGSVVGGDAAEESDGDVGQGFRHIEFVIDIVAVALELKGLVGAVFVRSFDERPVEGADDEVFFVANGAGSDRVAGLAFGLDFGARGAPGVVKLRKGGFLLVFADLAFFDLLAFFGAGGGFAFGGDFNVIMRGGAALLGGVLEGGGVPVLGSIAFPLRLIEGVGVRGLFGRGLGGRGGDFRVGLAGFAGGGVDGRGSAAGGQKARAEEEGEEFLHFHGSCLSEVLFPWSSA